MRKSRDVANSAFMQLRRMIEDGTLSRGATLPAERTLAKMMDISRGTLREALGVARAQGLVSSEPNGRAIVIGPAEGAGAPVSQWRLSRSLADIFEFRFVIESQVAAIAAMNASAGDVSDLFRMHRAFQQAAEAGVPDEVARKDEDFHLRVMRITGNKVFEECYDYFKSAFRDTYGLDAECKHAREAAIEHENIIAAIESRDPIRAAYFMRVHLLRSADRSGVALKKTPLAL